MLNRIAVDLRGLNLKCHTKLTNQKPKLQNCLKLAKPFLYVESRTSHNPNLFWDRKLLRNKPGGFCNHEFYSNFYVESSYRRVYLVSFMYLYYYIICIGGTGKGDYKDQYCQKHCKSGHFHDAVLCHVSYHMNKFTFSFALICMDFQTREMIHYMYKQNWWFEVILCDFFTKQIFYLI